MYTVDILADLLENTWAIRTVVVDQCDFIVTHQPSSCKSCAEKLGWGAYILYTVSPARS